MWIRVYRAKDNKEVLVNVNSIWKIEVQYLVVGDDRVAYTVSLEIGLKDPRAIRSYKLFFGTEAILLLGQEDTPALKVIQDIYNNAAKGNA